MTEPLPILAPQEVVNDTSVRVIRILVKTGCEVQPGQAIVELETSKSNIQVEAPAGGWLQLLCTEGEDIPVGGLLGRLFESKAGLDAVFSSSVQTTPPLDEPASDAGAAPSTVFSDQARALLAGNGLAEDLFKGRAFVRAADVRALLHHGEPVSEQPAPVPPRLEKATPDAAFQQTFADGWPLWTLIRSDLHRIDGRHDNKEMFHHLLRNPAFRYVFWFRIAQWSREHAWSRLLLYPLALFFLDRVHFRTGIRIPISVKAGPGLFLGHWGSMVVNPKCTLGMNCTLGNEISLGSAGGAGQRGVPQLGDNVYVGPGARLAGAINIGQNAAVMPNSLVTTDVPPGSIVIGVPHRVSGHQAANPFTSNTDYPQP